MARTDRPGRIARALVACAVAWSMAPARALALDDEARPSSQELVGEPGRFDGRAVSFRGEAVGEAMVRGDHAWLHINDDAYTYRNAEDGAPLGGYNSGMPVWAPASLAAKVRTFGDHRHDGDVVVARGVFNAACVEHGGDMDIHADALEVAREGGRAYDQVKPWKIPVAAVLSIAAALALVAGRRQGRREARGV